MNKYKLLVLLGAAMAIVLTASPALYAGIISPGDFIIGIDSDGDGNVRDEWGHYMYELIDGVVTGGSKALISGAPNGGFIVTPSGTDVVKGFEIATGNDTEGRDPSSWVLYGTNDAIASTENSTGTAENWTLIDSGTLNLPSARNTWSGIIAVHNSTAYTSYKMLFPSLKDPAITDMQMDEFQFTKYSVDAGADMVTWTGEPVQLAPTAGGYDPATSAYNWTVDVPAGVTASFDPSTTVLAPAVTFTKVPHANANIVNASFEDPFIPDDASVAGVRGDIPGWITVGGSVDPGVSNIGLVSVLYGGSAPDGRNMGWVEANQYLSQDLAETFQENATYTLTSTLGFDSRWGANQVTYAVQLLAGSVVIAEETGLITDPNNFVYASADYVYDAADADKIGLPLQIRLVGNDSGVSGTNGTVLFDSVVLTSSIPFPAPTGVFSVDLTLTVQDATNAPVSDSMTVEVYDDACAATLDGLNTAADLTDLNSDCVTNLEDFAELAKDWLLDYAYDTPQPKPAE